VNQIFSVGDTPLLRFFCVDNEGNPMDLSNLEESALYMKRGDSFLKRDLELGGTSVEGILQYQCSDEDLTVGDILYEAQVWLKFPDTKFNCVGKVTFEVRKTLEQEYLRKNPVTP